MLLHQGKAQLMALQICNVVLIFSLSRPEHICPILLLLILPVQKKIVIIIINDLV